MKTEEFHVGDRVQISRGLWRHHATGTVCEVKRDTEGNKFYRVVWDGESGPLEYTTHWLEYAEDEFQKALREVVRDGEDTTEV